jgi:hypothetical protein
LLRNRGVDIIAYDKFRPPKSSRWTKVLQGGPEVLSNAVNSDRNLFLCYPDESESMAVCCLELFKGEYIIHVGELMTVGGCGTMAGPPVSPFGRTSSCDFQIALAESFHCVLVAQLELRYPYSNDCISVWKRTRYIPGRLLDNVLKVHRNSSIGDVISNRKSAEAEGSSVNNKEQLEDESSKGFAVIGSKSDSSKKRKIELRRRDIENTAKVVEFISLSDIAAIRSASEGDEVKKSNQGGGSANLEIVRADKKRMESSSSIDEIYSEQEAALKQLQRQRAENIVAQRKLTLKLKRLREKTLDIQYNEDHDNRWTNIPPEESLPVDRAAPFLAHLL